MLIYLTLISGLACTNLLHGMGIIIKRWAAIQVDWAYPLSALLYFLTIADYWFHSFHYSYDPAANNILIFFSFLAPSTMLFFGTIIMFPRGSYQIHDYTQFFVTNLRVHILTYGLFILSALVKFYVLTMSINLTILLPLLFALISCALIYLKNSIIWYKALISMVLLTNILRWFYQGIVWW